MVLFPWNIDVGRVATLGHLSEFLPKTTRVLPITLVWLGLSYALLVNQVSCVDVDGVHKLDVLYLGILVLLSTVLVSY